MRAADDPVRDVTGTPQPRLRIFTSTDGSCEARLDYTFSYKDDSKPCIFFHRFLDRFALALLRVPSVCRRYRLPDICPIPHTRTAHFLTL